MIGCAAPVTNQCGLYVPVHGVTPARALGWLGCCTRYMDFAAFVQQVARSNGQWMESRGWWLAVALLVYILHTRLALHIRASQPPAHGEQALCCALCSECGVGFKKIEELTGLVWMD